MIKSYTDLEQAKKLAEILPLESADMYYPNRTDVKYQGALPIEFKLGNPLLSQEIAAWSIAALLNVLPKEINIEEQCYAPCLFPVQDKWLLKLWYNSNYTITSPIAIFSDNPVDACVEMVLKLHKLKKL